MSDGGGRVGVVIAGAGARGAYEIGALSVLVPWLCAHGDAPRVLVGTSAGAINAVLVAAMCSAPDPYEEAERAVHVWRAIGREDVFRTIALSGPETAARYVATLLGLPRTAAGASLGLRSLLDPAPLRSTVETQGPWSELHRAVRDGVVDGIAVATTAFGAGDTVMFVETADTVTLPADDAEHGIRYRSAVIGPDHVMASSAIPLAFPAVRIGADWFFDGGVLLNAPIQPCLALGAERLFVVATHPLPEVFPPQGAPGRVPDVFDVGGAVLTSVLVDRMAQDVRMLERINRLVAAGGTGVGYRLVPYLLVAPGAADTIGAVADRILRDKYDGLPWFDTFDLTVITRLVGGPGPWHAELLSFLLFDRDFIEELVDLGRHDAAQALRDAGGDTPFHLTRGVGPGEAVPVAG